MAGLSDYQEEFEELEALRSSNRVQRRANVTLRRAHKSYQEHSDEIFAALCQSQSAQAAIGELWARGGFTCGPEDYCEIVERSLEAIHALRLIGKSGTSTLPIQFTKEK